MYIGRSQSGAQGSGSWDIRTTESNTDGIFVVSSGGKGGSGGYQEDTGKPGGPGGDGGHLNILGGSTFSITTQEGGSNGVNMLSRGGNGGLGGYNGEGRIDGKGGNGGAGGSISVVGSFDIAANGSGAHGIAARSVGGTIYQGQSATSDPGTPGSGGPISVTLNGTGITAKGPNSIGIDAQSAAGQKGQGNANAGAIAIDANADITANGGNSIGIRTRSEAFQDGSSGDTTIAIAQGVTVSGGGDNSNGEGAGIEMISNGEKTINNEGTITTALGTNGVAIASSGSGHTTVNNSGQIIGSWDIGSSADPASRGTSVLRNLATGTIFSGNTLEADLIENAGMFYIGDQGAEHRTNIFGDYYHTHSGTLSFDLGGGSNGISDKLFVDGIVTFDSGDMLKPNTLIEVLLSQGNLKEKYGTYSLLYADKFDFGGGKLSDIVRFSNPGRLRFDASVLQAARGEVLQVTAAPIPVPAPLVLLASALGILGFLKRRTTRRAVPRLQD